MGYVKKGQQLMGVGKERHSEMYVIIYVNTRMPKYLLLVMENKLQCTCIINSLLFIYLYMYIYDMFRSGKLLYLRLLLKHYPNMGNIGYLINHNSVVLQIKEFF